jgi:hypothetical protein
MMVHRASPGRVLYARWEICAFRGVERFSDYKRIKDRMRPVMDNSANVNALRGGIRRWRSLLSDKEMAIINAVCAVVLVLLTAALLIATLQL